MKQKLYNLILIIILLLNFESHEVKAYDFDYSDHNIIYINFNTLYPSNPNHDFFHREKLFLTYDTNYFDYSFFLSRINGNFFVLKNYHLYKYTQNDQLVKTIKLKKLYKMKIIDNILLLISNDDIKCYDEYLSEIPYIEIRKNNKPKKYFSNLELYSELYDNYYRSYCFYEEDFKTIQLHNPLIVNNSKMIFNTEIIKIFSAVFSKERCIYAQYPRYDIKPFNNILQAIDSNIFYGNIKILFTNKKNKPFKIIIGFISPNHDWRPVYCGKSNY